ncbi:hypothetical protein [Dongshaea marina]|uniref:hypothetical protein n=1 Tax=Dongshaea marina TaxID=2047966 RepID=UPI000D3E93FB|nr:hypothetical protein [Dongshaea marina]
MTPLHTQMASLAVAMGFTLCVCAEQTLTLASGEWSPLTGEHIKEQGICTHIIKEALKKQGYKIQSSYFPWKRSYKLVVEGAYDIGPCWIKNSQRVEEILFSKEPILVMKKVFFTVKTFLLTGALMPMSESTRLLSPGVTPMAKDLIKK